MIRSRTVAATMAMILAPVTPVTMTLAIATPGVIGLASCSGSDPGAGVPTYRVDSRTFRREVPSDGTLEAVEATPIAAPQDARMPLKIAWMVKDGSRVSGDQVVIRFDPTEMSDRLDDGLDSTAQARKRIGKERATAATAQRKRDREAAMAESEMRASTDFNAQLDEEELGIFSRNEIIESRIDQDLSSAKMDHARAAKGIERSVSSGKLEVLRVQERQAAMNVSEARKGLSLLEVTAPHAGILVAKKDWNGRLKSVGDTVWPGQKIAEIPKDEAMEARVFVLETDGGALEVGMKATVTIESHPDRSYAASIARVETLAQPRFKDVPVQYFTVTLSLDKTDEVMKIGQRVRASILVAETEAIAVPRQAVFQDGGKSYVYRRVSAAAGAQSRGKNSSGFDKIEVELGAGTAGRVIVTSGLADGDEIALRQPDMPQPDDGDGDDSETARAERQTDGAGEDGSGSEETHASR